VMDCKELENKLLELEAVVDQERDIIKVGIFISLFLAIGSFVCGMWSASEQQQRLDRLEHMQGIDAIGRRVK